MAKRTGKGGARRPSKRPQVELSPPSADTHSEVTLAVLKELQDNVAALEKRGTRDKSGQRGVPGMEEWAGN